jgi:hypothetical protein
MTISRSLALSSVAGAQPPGSCQVVAAPRRSGIARRDNTRRYSIEIRDAATEKSVYAVAANWTEYEKREAVSRIMRLTGPAEDRD